MGSFRISIVFLISFVGMTLCQDVTDLCLGCICEASSGCKKDIGCTDAGVCGPLLISWPYWSDAGKWSVKGSSSTKAYSDCASDLYCAGQTVRSYMEKYKKDCNGDGQINCQDYAAIHLLGASGCVNPTATSSPFYQRFLGCFTKANQLSNK